MSNSSLLFAQEKSLSDEELERLKKYLSLKEALQKPEEVYSFFA